MSGTIHLIKCQICGCIQVVRVIGSIPEHSYHKCDLCEKNIALDYDAKTNNLKSGVYHEGTKLGKLNCELL